MKLGISYKTVSEVRAFTAQDVKLNPKVYITDSGKEGEFVHDSSDTTSSDNLGTILVAGTARYKRVFSDFVEPSWFYTSGSYSSAIQTSLSFGKKVFIKNGTYLIDSSINVPSNSVIIGEGKSTIIKLNANNLKAFNISGLAKSNITIKDLAIDGSGQTTNVFTGIRNSFGVYATNVTNLNLDNLYIYKMGIVNQSNVIDDNDQANGFANPTGGYGILVEAREGIIENILIENCKIENIAGGGNIFGDGICVQGYNTNLNIIPKNVIIKDCYVSEVARHCYSVAGGGSESLGNDVKIINCFGKNAALCGVDIEDGNNVILENSNFESCGITNSYYNPNTVYGSSYNLRAGISYANSSNYLFFTNVKVKNSYYGLTVGAGGNIIIDNLTIEGSVTKDIELGLARWGENISINNSKFLSNTTNSFNLYNSNFDSFIKFNNCYFVKSPIVSEIRNLSFENCTFNEKLLFVSTGIKRIKILNNTFNSDRGIETNAISQFIEDLEIHNNLFNTTLHGIYILYDSFIRTSIKGNTFKGGIGIFHNNANGNTPFDNISENKFIGCTTGIDIKQGIKDAVISKNTFKNISNWCINIHDIITASPTDVPFTNNIISHNIADSTCVNGLQVYASTGKILNSIFNYNLFDKCTNVDYNIVADFIDDISQIWKKSPIVSFTIDEVRAFKYSDVQSNKTLFIKDKDKEGFWEFDSADGSSADNIGTILVTTSGGFRYKRIYQGEVKASWFIDTADTTGTSGNRERNAINRAVTFSLAQTVSPTIILDNKRTWYVNTDPIQIRPALGQILNIVGEGNPIIDFYGVESFCSVFGNFDYTYTENFYEYGTFSLEGVQLDGSRNPVSSYLSANYGTRPIQFTNMERVEIRNCVFRNIYGSGMAIGVTKSGIIENNEFYRVGARQENPPDATGDAISVYAYCKDMQVLNNFCELSDVAVASGTYRYGRCGISIDDQSMRVLVSGNKIIGYERGLHIENCRDVTISNNHVFRSPASTSTYNKNCLWEGNIFDGKDLLQPSQLSGTGLFWTAEEEGSVFHNNIFRRWEGDGGQNLYLARFWGNGLSVTNNQFGEEKNANNSRTSTTSNVIETGGSKSFTFSANPNLTWKVGQRLRAYSTTDGYYTEGDITAVSGSGGTVTINVSGAGSTFGDGTKTSWMLHYASQGRVYATSFGKGNIFKENTFVKANLEIGATESAIVNHNIFKGCDLVASGVDIEVGDDQPTYNIQIVGNGFVPYTDEVHGKSIAANLTIKAYIANNIFRNPIGGVVGNTGSTGMICTNNTYIRSYASAAGNAFWYSDSNLANAGVNKSTVYNKIIDYINNTSWNVGNTGIAFEDSLVKSYRPNTQTLSSASSVTPNIDVAELIVFSSLGVNLTINAPIGTPHEGQSLYFKISDNATPRTITWNAIYRGVGVTLPVTTVASVPLHIKAVYNFVDTKWDVIQLSVPPTGTGDALTSGTLAQFAATTSAQLAGVISDETGTGALVFATSPTLVTPNLGTPSAIVLTNATSVPAGQLSGTIPTGVLGASTLNIGTTSIALNRASATQALTGITSIDGFAAAVTLTADNSTNATNYPLFANAATGNLSPRTDTGFTYNPSTGALTSTSFVGALTGNASTATSAATLTTPRTIGGVSFDGSAAIVPQTIQSVNEAADTTCFPLFISASGSQSLQPLNNTAFTFNASTGALGATTLVTGGSGITIGSSVPFSDSAGTLTLQNVDVLDATTEATIEAAIDTLANLTSIQGNTFTLTGAFIRSGAHSLTLTTTGTTSLTLPTSGTLATTSGALSDASLTVGTPTTTSVGYLGIPQNSQSAAYTLVLTDAGKHILHPSADTTARTFTIPANSSVAYPIGTSITFVNQNSAGVVTIAITTDTMRLAGAGTTGSRTLAANGMATALKITSTEWIISGNGLT